MKTQKLVRVERVEWELPSAVMDLISSSSVVFGGIGAVTASFDAQSGSSKRDRTAETCVHCPPTPPSRVWYQNAATVSVSRHCEETRSDLMSQAAIDRVGNVGRRNH